MKRLWDAFDLECSKPTPTVQREQYTCKCSSPLQVTEDNFYVCSDPACSILYTNNIDPSAEWRFYGEDTFTSNPTRCGMPINPLLQESSIGCKILCHGYSSGEMRRIHRFNEWQAMPYKEKARHDDFLYITTMANNAGISKMLVDEACKYHTLISEKQTFRGSNRDGIIAASIYIACRIENYPRTAEEIAHIFLLDRTSATKGCKNAMCIINEIEQSKPMQNMLKYSTTNPFSFMERFCTQLHMNDELTKLAQFIAKQIEKKNMIPENTPKSIAAGIIYFLSQEFNLNLTKSDIQTITYTSEVTINKCYQKINLLKHSLIPSNIYAKYK
jgi:transcription initiation factor TFIIB